MENSIDHIENGISETKDKVEDNVTVADEIDDKMAPAKYEGLYSEEKVFPSMEEEAFPSMEEEAFPSMEEEAFPTMEEEALTSMVEEAFPSMEEEAFPSMVAHQIVSREASLEPEPCEFTTSMASHLLPQTVQDTEHEIASVASAISKEIDSLAEKDVQFEGEPTVDLEFKSEQELQVQSDIEEAIVENKLEEDDMPQLESFGSMVVHQISSREASEEPKKIDSSTSMASHQVASREASMEPKLMDSMTSMASHRVSGSFDQDFIVPEETEAGNVIPIESEEAVEEKQDEDEEDAGLESFPSMVVHQIASREASMEPRSMDSITSMTAHQVGSKESSMEPKLMDSATSMTSHRISASFDEDFKIVEEIKIEEVANVASAIAKEITNLSEGLEETQIEEEKQKESLQEDKETVEDICILKDAQEEIINNEYMKPDIKIDQDIETQPEVIIENTEHVTNTVKEEDVVMKESNLLENQESDEETSGEEIPIIASFTFGENTGIVQEIKIETPEQDVSDNLEFDEESVGEEQAITASCTFGNNKPIVIETKVPEAIPESRDNYDKVSSEIITQIVNQRFSRNISNGETVKEVELNEETEVCPKSEEKKENQEPIIQVSKKEPTPSPESNKNPKKSILETLFGCFGCFKGQKS